MTTYAYDFQLTQMQMAEGMTIGGKDALRRGGSLLPAILSSLNAVLTIVGMMAVVWVVHLLITDKPALPPLLIILGAAFGMGVAIGTQRLYVNTMTAGVLKAARLRKPCRFTVSPLGITSDGNNARFDLGWSAIDTITTTETCVHFLAGGLTFILPKEQIEDLPTFLEQTHAWHKDAQT